VVALRFYAGMDSTTLGAVLELPAATVRTRLRRALELLRQDLIALERDGSPTFPTEEKTHG
jgi:DNA-directed RNA polymerase specialized sigma24 family protein